jgi:hypothetical protein
VKDKELKRKIGYFLRKRIGGHLSLGEWTIFGDNAMHFGGHVWTKKYGYVCFRLPVPCNIVDYFLYDCKMRWEPLYLYFSPNATPWAATFMLGAKHDRNDWALARVRKRRFGHNFSTTEYREELRAINNIL